jgi:sensor domain CHASE-containing protein
MSSGHAEHTVKEDSYQGMSSQLAERLKNVRIAVGAALQGRVKNLE